MDIDFLKSIPEDQIEMMLMMQMDKFHEVSESATAYNDIQEMQRMETRPEGSSSSTSNIGAIAQLMDNSPVASPGFMHQPSTISFVSSPPVHQEVSAMNFLSSSTSGRWRNESSSGGACKILDSGRDSIDAFPSHSDKRNSMAAMREMIFRIAALQPIHIDPESVKPPKRRNVKISNDPQSVAARHRRERISERIRILQRLVPGGTKMDTASMLDEAIHYVKFLKNQVQSLERAAANRPAGIGFPVPMSSGSYLPMATNSYQSTQNVQHYADV